MDDRIECDPNVMLGKPVVAGTRITVESVLEALAAGEPMSQILAEFPVLSREDVLAALAYAAHSLHSEFVYPLPGLR